MKKGFNYLKCLLHLVFVFSVLNLFGQEIITLGTSQENIAHSIKMYDGKYYIVGTTRKDSLSAKDYYVIELNANGSVNKTVSYGFLRHDVGSQILVDSQGVFVIGSAYDFGFSNVDMHLFELDENGNMEWEKFFGTQFQDMGFNLIRTLDGGFAMIGFSNTQTDGGDMYCVKTDNEGNLEWERFFGPSNVDYGFSLVENKNKELLFVGTQNGFYNPTQTDFITHDADILIVKTDNAGNEIWYKTFGGDGHEWAKDIILAPGGGYFVSGSTQSLGAGSFDVFLMKIDEDGNEVWTKVFGGPEFEYGEKLQLSADGNIIISATSASFSADLKPDHFILKIDLAGEEVWRKILDSGGSDYTSGLVATPDSGLVFTGWTNSAKFGKKDIVLYKLDKNGNPEIFSGILPFDSIYSFSLYPNPVADKFFVEILSSPDFSFDFFLFDSVGRKIFRKKVGANSKTEIFPQVNCGTFIYRIEHDGAMVFSGKLIIHHN